MGSSSEAGDGAQSTLDRLLRGLAHAPRLSAEAPRGRLLPGTRVDRYEVLAHLGEGGMGSVYRARDTRLGRDVALKVLRSGDVPRSVVQRFEREARALAALSHPGVVGIYDVGSTAEGPYLALELLEGLTLRERLRQGAVPREEALAIADQVLDGLAAAHAGGVTHRDLKPENIFLPWVGPATLLDFGLAKLVANERAVESLETQSGALLGTAAYLSPEQARGLAVDARSDLFAFGLVLYELLSGRRAFRAAGALETVYAVVHHEPEPLEALAPGLPQGLAACVTRCLEKDPNDRFGSAAEVREALAAALRPGAPTPTRKAPLRPVTAYAKSGAVHIGYQVAGEGPGDLLIVPGFVSAIEQLWEDPDSLRFFTRLARRSRLILFDKRNTGLSDRMAEGAPGLAERVDDVRAVMNAAGSSQAVLLGVSEGVPIAIRYAVQHPERVRGLILYAGFAWPVESPELQHLAALVRDGWGTGATLSLYGPSVAHNDDKRRWWARYERFGASPSAVLATLQAIYAIDVRADLPQVRVPTLVLHRTGDRASPVHASRYLARKIPGARLVEHAGEDHIPMLGDAGALLRDIEAFLAQLEGAP